MQNYKLYKDKITLSFDEKKHIYRVGKKIVYGVTSITSAMAKPFLINWAVKLTKEKAYSEAKRLGGVEFLKNLKDVLMTAGREHYVVSKEARELGTRVHKKAEQWLTKGANKAELIIEMIMIEKQKERLACSAMLRFFNEHKFEPIALEGRCYSKEHEYAGTVDYYGGVDGKLSVLDFKTSTGIYSSYPLQATAYAQAKEEEGFEVEQTMIARFGKDGVLEVQIEKDWKKYLPSFLAAKVLKEYEMSLKAEEFNKVENEPVKVKKVIKTKK